MSGTAAARGRGSRLSLVAVMAFALLFELLANRVAGRLVADVLLLPREQLQAIDLAGLFAFHLVSVLSVLLVALALLRLLARAQAHAPEAATPPSSGGHAVGRRITVVAMVGFVVIAALGLWRQLPPRLETYLLALFTFLSLQLLLAAWPLSSGRGRLRVWLVLLLAALVLHFVWIASVQMQWVSRSPYPRLLLSLGEAVAVTLAAAAPFCFLPSRRRLAIPIAVGLVVAGAALAFTLVDRPLAARLVAYVFGLELPQPFVGIVFYAVALCLGTVAIVALVRAPGPSRLLGYGLLIIGLSGYQLELPYQVASTLFGVLCLLEALSREQESSVLDDGWQALVRRVASRLGAREVVVAGPRGFEEMRMRLAAPAIRESAMTAAGASAPLVTTGGGDPGAVPVELSVRRASGVLEQAELVVGHAPSDEAPPLSLHGRGAPRLGRKEGAEVQTGDAAFDAAFATWDSRRLDRGDPLLTDELRPRLCALGSAWLGVWPGRGARLRSVDPRLLEALASDSPAARPALDDAIALLVELKRRAA